MADALYRRATTWTQRGYTIWHLTRDGKKTVCGEKVAIAKGKYPEGLDSLEHQFGDRLCKECLAGAKEGS